MDGRFDAELRRLAGYWRGFWPGADTERMAADVEGRARAALARWNLEDAEPLSGGLVALVVAAHHEGEKVILKVAPRGHGEEREMAAEAAALSAWAGSSAAVTLIDRRDDGLTLLLECLSPGAALDDAGLDGAARTRALAEVAARLRRSVTGDPPSIPSLREYSDPWRRHLAARPEELAELDDLLGGAMEKTVLHCDLHGLNVIDHRGSWVAIDPHGAYGDRDAEIWSLIDPRSPILGREAEEIRDAVAKFATVAGLDPGRAARWARLRAIGEAEAILGEGDPSTRHTVRAADLLAFADAVA